MNNSIVVYTTLLENLIRDISDHHCLSNSDRREVLLDIAMIRRRTADEGVQFLTCTLPLFGKALDRALLNKGTFTCCGFHTRNGLPRFLGWLTCHLFDKSGAFLDLMEEIDNGSRYEALTRLQAQCVREVRQIAYLFYKIDEPCSQQKQDAVVEKFRSVEIEMSNLDIDFEHPILRKARALVTDVLGSSDPFDIAPQHGPGAVSTKEIAFEKYSLWRTTRGLDMYYPFWEYMCPTVSMGVDQEAAPREFLDELPPAKVVLVPKDSRGPRLISCEPLEYQWLQQGLQKLLYATIENHRFTRGHVNFRDQSCNQRLALAGSRGHSNIVTLDMQDASDRVHRDLVFFLVGATKWLPALAVTRSTRTQLPNGDIVPLAKFAPMGSAVCFPIEALVFWAISVAVLTLNGYTRREACASVYVYGDDIIIKGEDYPLIISALELFGLKFNESKCCTSGFFRESCGCDAFRGVDVTPKRLRVRYTSSSRKDHRELDSYIQFANCMYERSYYRTWSMWVQLIERKYGSLPVFPPDSTYPFGLTCDCGDLLSLNRRKGVDIRVNRSLQRLEVKGYKLQQLRFKQSVPVKNLFFHALTRGGEASHGLCAIARRTRLIRAWVPVE